MMDRQNWNRNVVRKGGWWGIAAGAITGALYGLLFFALYLVVIPLLRKIVNEQTSGMDFQNELMGIVWLSALTSVVAVPVGLLLGAVVGGILGTIGGAIFVQATKFWKQLADVRLSFHKVMYATCLLCTTAIAIVSFFLWLDIREEIVLLICVLPSTLGIVIAFFGMRFLLRFYESETLGVKQNV